MFNRSRRNLAFWFTLSMGSILILFAGATYYLRAEDRMEATDRLLCEKTRLIAASLQYSLSADGPQVELENVPFLGNASRPLVSEILYVRWYDSRRQLHHFFGSPPPETIDISPGFRTIKPDRSYGQSQAAGEWLRQLTFPVYEENELIGYLQIAIPLTSLQSDLQQFQLALMLSVLVTLVLIGFTGWYLGGMAMQPIRQAYTQLQRFTADASHELRSPLSASLTNAQVALMMASECPQIRPSLENIIDSTQSMKRLVNNLLLLARHQGQLAPELLKPIDLSTFLEQLAVDYSAQAKTQNIKFILHIPERPVEIWGDLDLLKQAVDNLLNNACKFTPAGGTVWLRLERHSSWAIVQVVDTGVGIPAADLPYVFDRFYRVDAERTSDRDGFGLGLSLAQQVVQAHGGQLHATSIEQKGSTFQIELPMRDRPRV